MLRSVSGASGSGRHTPEDVGVVGPLQNRLEVFRVAAATAGAMMQPSHTRSFFRCFTPSYSRYCFVPQHLPQNTPLQTHPGTDSKRG